MSCLLRLSVACVLLATPVSAQLSDLQPGPNFEVAAGDFGTGRSENLDVGDLDRDGDLDVVVGNGGDASAQLNRVYINLGGAQLGVEGTFVDGTAARFAGVPADTTRDIELADIDGDGDLDVQVSNRGTLGNGGEPSRIYRNLGGAQGGPVAFFVEDTDAAYGQLVSIPAALQVLGDDRGPFQWQTRDSDFGDLDLDGDLDLLHASAGPAMLGTLDSLVFLNDGTGRFDELSPWADALADIQLHTCDIDLVDLDDDFDLDLFASSRDSQARVYRNELDLATRTWPGDPFTDTTSEALLLGGAGQVGLTNYELEFVDLEGDGDFDVWAVNYAGFEDRVLVNQGDGTFTLSTVAIVGDPNLDELGADTLDYDGDGDLDVFMGNFSGMNVLYQSGLAQGLDAEVDGMFHRNFSTSPSLAPWNELPVTGFASLSLDGECADLDGDGDPDLLLANDADATNPWAENVLGIPDTHAPTVHALTAADDVTDGAEVPIVVQLRDNSPWYVIDEYDVDLVYAVDGGLESRVRMASQRGQQWQATIPGGLQGTVAYRVEGADRAGNAFVSASETFAMSGGSAPVVQVVGSGTPGADGIPDLAMLGPFTGGSTVTLSVVQGAPSAHAVVFFSLASTPLPFKGGLLHTIPVAADLPLATDAGGLIWVRATWPNGVPAGAQLWQQVVMADPSVLPGATLTNAVLLTTP